MSGRQRETEELEIEASVLLDSETVVSGGGTPDIVPKCFLNIRLGDEAIEDLWRSAKRRELGANLNEGRA